MAELHLTRENTLRTEMIRALRQIADLMEAEGSTTEVTSLEVETDTYYVPPTRKDFAKWSEFYDYTFAGKYGRPLSERVDPYFEKRVNTYSEKAKGYIPTIALSNSDDLYYYKYTVDNGRWAATDPGGLDESFED